MEGRRVVVTGMGIVSPVGLDVASAWESLVAGRSGIRRITRFDVSGEEWKVKIAGEAHGFDPANYMDKKDARRVDRTTQLALAAAQEAVTQSCLTTLADRDDVGVMVGCGSGGIETYADAYRTLLEKGPGRMNPFLIPAEVIDSSGVAIGIRYGFHGPNFAVTSACATGADAIGTSFLLIRAGQADVMLAGGTEAAVHPLGIGGFDNLRALSRRNDAPERASRPFDKERDGFVLSEGAAIVVLEELGHAIRRGATPLAELVAYAVTSDASHITAPDPDARQQGRAVTRALAMAGVAPAEVGYINAHATSTPLGDPFEIRAYRAAFGERLPPLSSTKSMTGHLLGAAGSAEAIFTVQALRTGVLPPTINQETADPECDTDVVPNVARKAAIDVAMSSAFGFGGHNSVLLFRRV
ncbi:MAG TPA: beta-ketoacyl-ACP synthase II [Candidatus Limnocylindria bacterium]|nr:beta-ketoacyl-ACP synthase II [Candidatus Limnocylindria bacterium]